jgi:hypothetical protein
VEGRRGVEPHPELLLPPALPLAVHVRVHRVRLPARVPQELEVDLVVLRTLRRKLCAWRACVHTPSTDDMCSARERERRQRIYTKLGRVGGGGVVCSSTYIEGGDGAGGVPRDELELHVEAAVEVLGLGLEARAGGPVHGQRQELAVVEDLAAAVAPGDVHVLVEVAAGARGSPVLLLQQQQQHRHQNQRLHGSSLARSIDRSVHFRLEFVSQQDWLTAIDRQDDGACAMRRRRRRGDRAAVFIARAGRIYGWIGPERMIDRSMDHIVSQPRGGVSWLRHPSDDMMACAARPRRRR